MSNPILVEVTRGGLVESRHSGALAIVDASGKPVLAIGDVSRPVFPRSAVKPMQALLLLESGAADAYGFGNKELALASASHGGEPEHVAVAAGMLRRAGLDETALACGVQAPSNEAARKALIREGREPSQLNHNCSGKHSGFLCAACRLGWPTVGYVEPAHPVQTAIRGVIEDFAGIELGPESRATDGCSIPTYAVPIERLAFGFARYGSGEGISRTRAAAARRLMEACWAEPFYIAGTGRFCTEALSLFGGRLLVKTGAEGVYCAAFPALGLGVALKIDDGATRASETAMAAVIEAVLGLSEEERGKFAKRLRPPVLTMRGAVAGEVRPAAELTRLLSGSLR